VVVVRVEAVVAQVVDARDELVEPRRVLPGGLELLRFIVLRDQLVDDDARAPNVMLLLVAQVVDAFADGFGQRIGDGNDRCNRDGCCANAVKGERNAVARVATTATTARCIMRIRSVCIRRG
jgi:hypothetical protein